MTYRPAAPGDQITRGDDPRITRVGAVLRRYRLDEISQLIDILRGTMSFVGTRPEVPDYVRQYTPQMRATLLLPAGVTSTASIEFKDEAQILAPLRRARTRTSRRFCRPRCASTCAMSGTSASDGTCRSLSGRSWRSRHETRNDDT